MSRILRNQKNRAGLIKESGFLVLLLLIGGCGLSEKDPSRYQCETDKENPLVWRCTKDTKRFTCETSTCVPTWCDLPLQACGLEPLTGGTDECGFPCSKPSTQWSNCIGEPNEQENPEEGSTTSTTENPNI